MGGLVEDSKTFNDPMNGIGGPNWLDAIADHWVEASQRHGMPVAVTEFVKTPLTSTWPSNVAYEAAKLQDVTLANRYPRRLREVAATEGAGLDQVVDIQDLFALGRMGFNPVTVGIEFLVASDEAEQATLLLADLDAETAD